MVGSSDEPSWQKWVLGIVAAVVISYFYNARDDGKILVSLSTKVDNLTNKLDSLSSKVEVTRKTADDTKLILEEGIRQTLQSQEKRVATAEGQISKLYELMYSFQSTLVSVQATLDGIRRSSETERKPR